MPSQPAAVPGAPHPLDEVPQTFLPGDSFDVRDGLVTYIRRDLLGPWGGAAEELPHRSAGPRDRYLLGMLGPRPDGELAERLTPQAAGRIWASSMGLSFVVPASIGTLTVTATWGRYSLTDTLTDDGRTLRVWGREPVQHLCDIDVTTTGDQSRFLEGEQTSGACLDVQVRERVNGPGGEAEAAATALGPSHSEIPQAGPVRVDPRGSCAPSV